MALQKTLSRNFRRYEPCPEQREHDQLFIGGYAPSHAVSIACYFNGTHSSVDQHLIGMANSGYSLTLKSLDGHCYLAGRIGVRLLMDDEPIDPKEWIHAALTWDGEIATLYKNGEIVSQSEVTRIGYDNSYHGTDVWAFSDTEGGNSYQLSLNLFTIWGEWIDDLSVKYLSNGGNPGLVDPESIRLGDFMDSIGSDHVFGDFIPCTITNEGIISNNLSPFPQGYVPYEVPYIQVSSSTSSSSTSSTSTSSTSTSSTSSTSSSSSSTSSSSTSRASLESSTSSSIDPSSESSSSGVPSGGNTSTTVYSEPGEYLLIVPGDVDEIYVKLWGAGAGGQYGFAERVSNFRTSLIAGAAGGGGAFIDNGGMPVIPGSTLTIIVGAGGDGGTGPAITTESSSSDTNTAQPGGDTSISDHLGTLAIAGGGLVGELNDDVVPGLGGFGGQVNGNTANPGTTQVTINGGTGEGGSFRTCWLIFDECRSTNPQGGTSGYASIAGRGGDGGAISRALNSLEPNDIRGPDTFCDGFDVRENLWNSDIIFTINVLDENGNDIPVPNDGSQVIKDVLRAAIIFDHEINCSFPLSSLGDYDGTEEFKLPIYGQYSGTNSVGLKVPNYGYFAGLTVPNESEDYIIIVEPGPNWNANWSFNIEVDRVFATSIDSGFAGENGRVEISFTDNFSSSVSSQSGDSTSSGADETSTSSASEASSSSSESSAG